MDSSSNDVYVCHSSIARLAILLDCRFGVDLAECKKKEEVKSIKVAALSKLRVLLLIYQNVKLTAERCPGGGGEGGWYIHM